MKSLRWRRQQRHTTDNFWSEKLTWVLGSVEIKKKKDLNGKNIKLFTHLKIYVNLLIVSTKSIEQLAKPCRQNTTGTCTTHIQHYLSHNRSKWRNLVDIIQHVQNNERTDISMGRNLANMIQQVQNHQSCYIKHKYVE